MLAHAAHGIAWEGMTKGVWEITKAYGIWERAKTCGIWGKKESALVFYNVFHYLVSYYVPE